MLDVASSREAFDSGNISNICIFRSEDNLAEGLAKIMSQAAPRDMLMKGKHNVHVVLTILRNSTIDQVIK